MTFMQINTDERADLIKLSDYGYEFDWAQTSSERSILVGSVHDGTIAGLVEFERRPETLANFMFLIEVADDYKGSGVAGKLLAYVGRDSLNQGFEGFVFFEPKTALANYYQTRYGAKPAGKHQLFFDTDATNKLVSEYLEDGE